MDAASVAFKALARPLTAGEGGWLSDVGQHLDPEQRAELVAALEPAEESRDVDEMVRLLSSQIRDLAGSNPFVGPDVMVTVIPREAVERGASGGLVASAPGATRPTFLFVAGDGSTTVHYGPVHVCGGIQSADFVAGPVEAIPPRVLNARGTRPR